MNTISIHFTVNGMQQDVAVRAHATLLDVLREQLGLMGTHEGCRMGECGACTVLMDGKAVNACLVLAPDAEGRVIITVEGLAENGALTALQRAFVEYGAVQCGYCTAGMLMTATAFLEARPETINERTVREALAGNLCRCTGYAKIVCAIMSVANLPNEQNRE